MFQRKNEAEIYEAMRAACERAIEYEMTMAANTGTLPPLERARVRAARKLAAHGVLLGFRAMIAAGFPPGEFPLDRDAAALETRILVGVVCLGVVTE